MTKDIEDLLDGLRTFKYRNKTIPKYMNAPIIRYFCIRLAPGSFLRAVLENDLKGAVRNADDQNIELLHVYIAFLYNYAPVNSYGSVSSVQNWLDYEEKEKEKETDNE